MLWPSYLFHLIYYYAAPNMFWARFCSITELTERTLLNNRKSPLNLKHENTNPEKARSAKGLQDGGTEGEYFVSLCYLDVEIKIIRTNS